MFDGNQPYAEAIKKFASITREEFKPENIQDNFSFDNVRVTVGFSLGGKQYWTSVDIQGDWYDEGFLTLINQALEENNLEGRFYDLPDGGQISHHIYLTASQYEYLKTHELLEFYKK